MKPVNELEHFIQTTVFEVLKDLSPDAKPLWGEMNAQQMVEHLVLSVEISNGKRDLPLYTEKEKVEKVKNVALLSNRPLGRGFRNPALPVSPLLLMYKDIEEAKQVLRQSIDLFMHYFRNNVETTRVHNMFGPLDYHEWLWFHYKHFLHHFMQFGLVPEVSRIE
jgi:hydroxymethylglutaryl-CoA reductase